MERLQGKVSDVIAEHPAAVAFAFAGLLALSVPVLMGAEVFLSIYELSPRAEYYDHFTTLNRDLGWDNLGAVLMTRPPDKRGEPVTEPRAVRMMNDVELELEQLEFVEGAYSLAEIVRIINSRPNFMAAKYAPGDGVPRLPTPPLVPQPRDQATGFPEEGRAGDARINASLDIALETLGDQIYGNILAHDNQSALMVVIMDPNGTGPEFRAWQRALLTNALALEDDVDHAGELELRPLSIDIIYTALDDVTYTEAPTWVMAALLTATAVLAWLFRRVAEVSFALIVLVIVAATTLAAALVMGVDFNLLSLLVAALIFAAGVDYAMHVIARYREERELGFDARSAMETTITTTGPALLITTVTDTAGFMSLYFSLIPAIGQFGAMVGVGMFVSFITCLTLLPVLLMWIDRVRGDVAGTGEDPEVLAARRAAKEAEVRARQRKSVLGRLGAWLARNPKQVGLTSAVVLAVLALPLTQ
ncbi:MAG: MMPL family transporter, partial [Candidatus Thermoplasmatota archaeon]|nr:MMPL family transporter [Candidatus Thermoplasmatota archaeon]